MTRGSTSAEGLAGTPEVIRVLPFASMESPPWLSTTLFFVPKMKRQIPIVELGGCITFSAAEMQAYSNQHLKNHRACVAHGLRNGAQ
jgi:hypothetical protein